MILTFDRERMQRLLDHTKNATEWNAQWQCPETAVPGLILVGDQGVYFMDNTKRSLLEDGTVAKGDERSGSFKCFVCYADQINPERMAFDEWWSNKRAYYGGDDGSQFFPADHIEIWLRDTIGKKLSLDITPTQISLVFPCPPAKSSKKKKKSAAAVSC